ncbi:hypothetical protein JCM11491_004243 [Sporobolomyces phaffii]
MRIPLEIAPSFASQLPLAAPAPSDPPLVFIDSEPFIVEFQGKLDLPEGEADESGGPDEASRLRGSRVGKVDLSDPKKPTMRIAHHRLEGKIETLLTPYALLRTSRLRESPTSEGEEGDADEDDRAGTDAERVTKRQRLAGQGRGGRGVASQQSTERDRHRITQGGEEEEGGASTKIEIVGIIRKKIVFNKRPEPLIEVSSEADPMANSEGRKEKEAKRGPKGLLGFTGGKR